MFRTDFNIDEFIPKIKIQSKTLFIGSCFTENIGERIKSLHLQNIINPFGVIYNPASVAQNLRILINKKRFTHSDLEFYNNKWFSFKHHGKFSDKNKDICLQNINNELNKSSDFLKDSEFLFITFGTSWVYKLKKDKKIVANCHKIPATEFFRERLNISDISEDYTRLINDIKKINNKIKIIFTVSPVRHWKDGANGNQLSKSILLLAIEEIIKQNSNTFYFPSYEIIMDDLRDYRFYSPDMLHINQIAINYIWQKFEDVFFDNKLKEFAKKIEKLNNALNHRIEDKKSKESLNFINSNIKKIEILEKDFCIDLVELKSEFIAKLQMV